MRQVLRILRLFPIRQAFSLKKMGALGSILFLALGCSNSNNSKQLAATSPKENLSRTSHASPLPATNLKVQKNTPTLSNQNLLTRAENAHSVPSDLENRIGPVRSEAITAPIELGYDKSSGIPTPMDYSGASGPLSSFNGVQVPQDSSNTSPNSSGANPVGNSAAFPRNPMPLLAAGLINPSTSSFNVASLVGSQVNPNGSSGSSNSVSPPLLLNIPPQGTASPPSLPILNIGNTGASSVGATSLGASTSGGTNSGTSTSVNPALVSGTGSTGSSTTGNTNSSGGGSGGSSTSGNPAPSGDESGTSDRALAAHKDLVASGGIPGQLPTTCAESGLKLKFVSFSGKVFLYPTPDCPPYFTPAPTVTLVSEDAPGNPESVVANECGAFHSPGKCFNLDTDCSPGSIRIRFHASYDYYIKNYNNNKKCLCNGDSDTLSICDEIKSNQQSPSANILLKCSCSPSNERS